MILSTIAISALPREVIAQAFAHDNLYYQALLATLEKKKSIYADRINRSEYETIVVAHNVSGVPHVWFKDLPSKIASYPIEYLGPDELSQKYKKLKKKFPILVVRPMRNDGASIKIEITDYRFDFSDKRNGYSLEGGTVITFHFDCDKGFFVLADAEVWGV